MDYEKKYNEALERAKEQLEEAKVFDYKEEQIAHDIRTTAYAIFPELKESEDEVKINRIVACLENLNVADNDILLKDIEWLKSLKDRIQPKQEWTAEDERIVTELIGIFESAVDGGHVTFPYRLVKDYIRVLKSCLSQSTWKPSDEQLDALQYVYRNLTPQLSDKLGWNKLRTLELMYQELKKLKDE